MADYSFSIEEGVRKHIGLIVSASGIEEAETIRTLPLREDTNQSQSETELILASFSPPTGGGNPGTGGDISRLTATIPGWPAQMQNYNGAANAFLNCAAPGVLRRPDWVEYHPGNPFRPNPGGAVRNGGRSAINLKNRHGRNPGDGIRYQALMEELLNMAGGLEPPVYIFGFLRALETPITIRVREWSPAGYVNRPEPISIRLGGLFRVLPGGGWESRFSHPRTRNVPGGSLDQFFTINNLPAELRQGGAADGPSAVHWLLIQDHTQNMTLANQRGGGADVIIDVCAGNGNQLQVPAIRTNILFLVDATGSTYHVPDQRRKIMAELRNLRVELEAALPDANHRRFAIRTIGAGGTWNGSGVVKTPGDRRYSGNPAHAGTGDGARYRTGAPGEVEATARTDTNMLMGFNEAVSNMADVEARVGALLHATHEGESSLPGAADQYIGYSPVWRALYEANADFQEARTLPGATAGDRYLIFLLGDGEDTIGGYIASGVEIKARKQAYDDIPPPSPDNWNTNERNEKIAQKIREDVSARLGNATDGLTTGLRSLRDDFDLQGRFVVVRPPGVATTPDPLQQWFNPLTIAFGAPGAAGAIVAAALMNARWCHPACRINTGAMME